MMNKKQSASEPGSLVPFWHVNKHGRNWRFASEEDAKTHARMIGEPVGQGKGIVGKDGNLYIAHGLLYFDQLDKIKRQRALDKLTFEDLETLGLHDEAMAKAKGG